MKSKAKPNVEAYLDFLIHYISTFDLKQSKFRKMTGNNFKL